MPALHLFGRKWLAATDDLVYPGLFEIFIRVVWFVLIGIACLRYYGETWQCKVGGQLVRVFFGGELVILGVVTILVFVMVNHSARGSIADTYARRFVEPLLTVKVLLLLPEIAWNILGTMWVLSDYVECTNEHYTIAVIEALVFFDWVLIGLALLGLALVFDPLGSLTYSDKVIEDSVEHGKVSRIWLRRFKFFWWMHRDESATETFQHVAGLLSALFRGTDLVPSDVVAGCILLRIRQKRETIELRRLKVMDPWMSLEWAHHYMKLSIASYGWLFVLYQNACTGCCKLIRYMSCCSCLRRHQPIVLDDNCCLCSLAGVKYLSQLSQDDILFASFRNHLCEIPFCVVADHKTASVVIVIRGSLSLRDLITDIAAASDSFEPEGLPPGSMAHRGMIIGAKVLLKQLDQYKILEKAFATYPNYGLTVTDFVLTVGLGDDLVMRLSVDSMENFRTSLLITLQACKLPKYRVVLNGFGYALFGVPDRDLHSTWRNANTINSIPGQLPLLAGETSSLRQSEAMILERDVTRRRYSKYEMRWAEPEDFMELSVMPRMLLDHLPENLELALSTLIKQQEDLPVYLDST
ncbi:hypothetical protein G9C98_004586 [Cotesia typhae]|uniref:Uncharacterized protein n=1 Tax=Cotesia typhae TaxID=2053667 RepID=A0A8J5QX58_9HYME|nr:hypothetical protein G9C98_004586 [Cotesia typhae]